MRRLAPIALGLILVTVALPATVTATEDDQSIREQNRAWLLEHNPDYDPDAIVEMHRDGTVETVTAAEALELALDRLGERSLASLTSPSTHDEDASAFVGYIWIIGTGEVNCGEVTHLAEVPFAPIELTWVPDGFSRYVFSENGYTSGTSASTYRIEAWTTGASMTGSGPVHYGGNSDFACIDGPGLQLLFPVLSGYALADDVPAPHLPAPALAGLTGS